MPGPRARRHLRQSRRGSTGSRGRGCRYGRSDPRWRSHPDSRRPTATVDLEKTPSPGSPSRQRTCPVVPPWNTQQDVLLGPPCVRRQLWGPRRPLAGTPSGSAAGRARPCCARIVHLPRAERSPVGLCGLQASNLRPKESQGTMMASCPSDRKGAGALNGNPSATVRRLFFDVRKCPITDIMSTSNSCETDRLALAASAGRRLGIQALGLVLLKAS